MKFVLLVIVAVAFLGSIQCDSLKPQEKRFLKSWFDTIKDKVINPVVDGVKDGIDKIKDHVVNPVVDGVNTGIDKIKNLDKLIVEGVLKPIGNVAVDAFGNVVDGLDTAVKTVWKPVQNVAVDSFGKVVGVVTTTVGVAGNLITILGGGGPSGEQNGGIQQEPNFCEIKCTARNIDGSVFDFEQNNGCISKGFENMKFTYGFNSCCDTHNKCLNQQCCTTDCQAAKNKCNDDFKKCMRGFCRNTYDEDYDNLDDCNIQANRYASIANASRCNSGEVRNRKLCIC